MINVFDPYFEIGESDMKTSEQIESSVILPEVQEIAGAMGYSTVETHNVSQDRNLTLTAIDDNLYNTETSIIIPILFSTTNSTSIGKDYTASNVSYLVISPRNNTTTQTDTTTAPHYSITDSSGAMNGTGTATAEKSADQVKLESLTKPGSDVPVTSAGDILVAGVRLVNYRLYRSVDDDYPIIFDNIDSLVYGYKKDGSEIKEIVISNSSFSISLISQVLSLSVSNSQTFPIVPTKYTDYTAAGIKVYNNDTDFDSKEFPFYVGANNVGLSQALFNGSTVAYCRTFGEIYILKNN